jgi:hypothetical protein
VGAVATYALAAGFTGSDTLMYAAISVVAPAWSSRRLPPM